MASSKRTSGMLLDFANFAGVRKDLVRRKTTRTDDGSDVRSAALLVSGRKRELGFAR